MTPAGAVRLVVPCYNEAQRLDRNAFLSYQPQQREVHFTFVDDGSRDHTAEVISQLIAVRPGQMELLRLPANRGKAEAVRTGLQRVLDQHDEPILGFWDADLATPLDAIELLATRLEARPQTDMALGSRVKLMGHYIERRPHRHYLGRVFATFASLALGMPIYDTQCGAKLFRRGPRLAAALAQPFGSRWVFDVELLARYVVVCREHGVDPHRGFVEVPLPEWRDVGTSKVKARDFFVAFFDLIDIARRYRRARRR